MTERNIVKLDNVSVVFGDNPKMALALMDQGLTRDHIYNETGQVLGVHNCTFNVSEGSIVVLMGLSGSGKSTLLRAINGLNKVIRGQVCVHDGTRMVDVGKIGHTKLRHLRLHRVAMVFQQFGLLPWRNVIDNIALPLEFGGIKKADRHELISQQLKLVGLENDGERAIGELSGGMQQRVGLARALVADAPILLMDEPFSALDPLIRSKLQDDLLQLQSQLQRTIVFVSHDLGEALKIGSKIIIMDGGRIIQQGSPQDIILSPANSYVAEFVSQVNPLNVLRACDIMTGLGSQQEITVDKTSGILRLGGQKIATMELRDGMKVPNGTIAVVAPEMGLRDLMKVRQDSEMPIVVAEGRAIIGVITDKDIYNAIIEITEITKKYEARAAV